MSMETDPQLALRDLEKIYFGPDMHEAAEISRLPQLVQGVRCFADIGASLGQYSFFAAKALKGAHFYCVEADPYKVARLRELSARWEVETGNYFHIIAKAASDRRENITLFIPENHMSSGAFFPLTNSEVGWMKVDVEAATIDTIFEGLEVDFMKMDVEGAEYRALVGAERLMRRRNLKLLLEIAPWGDKERGTKPSDVLRLLASYGYDFQIFENHYLFSKGGSAIGRWLKSRAMGFVLDRTGVKRRVKSLFKKVRGR